MKFTRLSLDRLLFGEVWAFDPADNDERWGRMVFLYQGRIFGYDNHNEFAWDFKAGTLRLKRPEENRPQFMKNYWFKTAAQD